MIRETASYSDDQELTGDCVHRAVSNGSTSFGFRDLDSTAIPDLTRSIERGDYTPAG